MNKFIACSAAFLLGMPLVGAQFQEVRIFGSTAPVAGRFTLAAEQTWCRIPGDQIGGAVTVRQQRHWMVDFGPAGSTETIVFHLGVDAGGLPATVASAGPFTVAAGGGTIFRLDWGPGVVLPVPYPGCATPTHDLWVGVEDRGVGAPLFPANGLGWVFDTAEAPSPHPTAGTPPYAAGGTFGLNYFEAPPASGAVPAGDFTNFFHSVLVDQDVLQGIASDAGGVGFLSPNLGFAALCPDPGRGDTVGLRLGTKRPPGATAALIVSPFPFPYTPIGGIIGGLCVAPPFVYLGPAFGGPSVPPVTGSPVPLDAGQTPGMGNLGSQIVWGPFPPGPVPPGAIARIQALLVGPGGLVPELSTMMTIYFP